MKFPYNMIISFEGLDCCFKETNYKAFVNRLRLEYPDKKIETASFPRYHDVASYFVSQYLSGECYDRSKLKNRNDIVDSFFALDRFDYWYAASEKGNMKSTKKHELDCDPCCFIFDRYTLSNAIYNTLDGQFPTAEDICFDYDHFNVPLPDIVVWMRMRNFDKIVELLLKKKDKDANELDINYLRIVWERSERLINSDLLDEEGIDLVVIECLDDNGEIKSKEELEKDVYDKISIYINNER